MTASMKRESPTAADVATDNGGPGRLSSAFGRGKGPARPLVASLIILALLYSLFLFVLRPAKPGINVSLDGLLRAAAEAPSRVRTARFLDEDKRITGTMIVRQGERPREYHTAYPSSDAATNDILRSLIQSGARVEIDSQPNKRLIRFLAQFLLPLVILANLFALLFSLGKGGDAGGTKDFLVFGKIGNRQLGSAERGRTTFADVAASEEPLAELMEVRDYLADPSAFKAMGAMPPKGVLIMGPPGCGKTLMARAVAGEANAAFFAISGSEFVESLVGVGAARVRDLFRQARAAAPAILFIDELDAVGRQRGAGLGGGHDEREQTLNEMLVQMDGFSPTEGLVVMGATNRPDILDPALLRPGRFDRQITVERSDREGRLRILRLHSKGKRLADPEADLPGIAASTPGFTGADLANVLNEAALLAVRERAGSIGRAHLDEAVERVLAGPRRRAQVIAPHDKRRIAIHESGHAVVAAAMGKTGELDKLSIIARGRGIGHLALLGSDAMLPTREDMEAQVTIAMAGIAAEELILGQPSTGSEADLERATTLARDMAGRYGFSERVGRVRVLRDQREVFLGRDYLLTKDVSQPTLEHLDAEVRRILDEKEEMAKAVLASHRRVLEGLAEALVNSETIKGEELQRALRGVRPFRAAEPVTAGYGDDPARRAPARGPRRGNGGL